MSRQGVRANGGAEPKTTLTTSVVGYQAKPGRFDVLTLEPRAYLMIDGMGDPNTCERFAAATSALFQVSYALKFASKAAGRDYVVPPLEGLWQAGDLASFTTQRDKAVWQWTLLMYVPAWLTGADVSHAMEAAARKKTASSLLPAVRLETLDEGLVVQTLHLGPFDDEGPVIAALHDSVAATHRLRGSHHEIYLGDFRRVAPEKRRTILRQPITPAQPIAPAAPETRASR